MWTAARRGIASCGLTTLLLALALPAQAAIDLAAYELDVRMDPATHRLEVTAEVGVPAEAASRTIDFALAGKLAISASTPRVEELAGDTTAADFSGINGTSADLARRQGVKRYRVTLPAGATSFSVQYAGPVDLPPTASAEEYARSFQETPGIINEDGVYLAGSTLWYPYLGDGLVTFSISARTPPDWHLIAPGNGVSTGDDNVARWESPSPVDEISLVGGPLIAYRAPGPIAEAEVFLRKPDSVLAERYLSATSRYLRMYVDLIGPYPYTKFALVENFWETGYGMPSYTLLGSQIIRFPFILTSSYPHEILHNWWGNSVYVDYGTGNWAEGLTAYLADHLMKEGEGLGHEYRRDTLKKYRSFAGTDRDFPLQEFRSRHSAATEAVGYGKTLMGFHMLRQRLGDATFRRGLAQFYRDFRGKRASFRDAQRSFEAVSGEDLGRFFDELTTRAGAADLAVENVEVKKRSGGYTVTGAIRQRQAGPFELQVPVVVTTAGKPVTAQLKSSEAVTRFSIDTDEEPLLLAVDPEFDVFRVLDAREIAPSIGQLFGAEELLAVVPAEPAAEQASWREAVAFWQGGIQNIRVATDAEVKELPADQSVWLLGRDNRLAGKLFRSEPGFGLAIDKQNVGIAGETVAFADHSLVLVHRHPADMELAVAWVTGDPVAARDPLVRKLPHYGKYSWLGFAGAAADNVAKGEWPTADSPLRVSLRKGAPPVPAMIPDRHPLAEPPPEFSAARLMQHVQFLAAPEREGRGFGTQGLEEAARYVAGQFEAAGLKPGGDDGSFMQTWTSQGGVDGKSAQVHNIIGFIPGSNPAFANQAALVTAHYDHLGLGWPGGRADFVGQLHPGANDNASGVAVLIELARALAAAAPPPRSIVFVAFGDEEAGLRGSRHYVANPLPVPLEGIVGIVNMDTVGRLGDQPVSILGAESAREWPFVFRGISAVSGIPTRVIPGASESSDQMSFIEAGIPGVQIFTGADLDYHKPSDTADKIDGDGMIRVATVTREAIGYLASTDKALTVTIPGRSAAAGSGPQPGGESRRVSVGAVPDFAFQGAGLRLDGVVPESPADKAGMKTGDILTHLGGETVNGLGGFNELLKKLKPGDEVELRWTRDGAPGQAVVELAER